MSALYPFNATVAQMLRAPFPLWANCPVHQEKDCRPCGGTGRMPFDMVITYRVQKALNNLRSPSTFDPQLYLDSLEKENMDRIRDEWRTRVAARLAHFKETWTCRGHAIMPYHSGIGHLPDGSRVYRLAGLKCVLCGYEPGRDDLPYKGWGASHF